MVTETILKVGTEEAVKNVADLKNNIKLLREELNDENKSQEENAETAELLRANQLALKEAMYATAKSTEELIAQSDQLLSANGDLHGSYNDLVALMGEMKAAWRVTTDEVERAALGEKIDGLNDKLKELDAGVGSYKRNVGNYTSALDGMGGILKDLPPTLGATKERLGKVGQTMQLVGKQPILGIIGLLAPVIVKITESLKDNATVLDAMKKAMAALQPVFDLASGVLEKIAGWISKAVDYFVTLAGESGDTFKNIIAGAVGVGNVLLQYILTPVKTVIEAFKGLGNIIKDIFTGEFAKIKEDAATAFEGIKDAFVDGFSFKTNFDLGKQVGEQFVAGLGSSKESAAETASEIAEAVNNELMKIDWDKVNRMTDNTIAARIEASEKAQKLQSEIDASIKDDTDETLAYVDNVLAEIDRNQQNAEQNVEDSAKMRMTTLKAVASGTSSILGTIADMYEDDEENAEKNAGKIKALRIAQATIDTISGAISAYMGCIQTIPGIPGIIMGAVQAAAVTMSGIAQIASIKKQKIGDGSSDSSSSSSSSISSSAFATAPTVETEVDNVRSVTTASEEERLNQMASSQRVYILSSDIEASQTQRKTQVAESSF